MAWTIEFDPRAARELDKLAKEPARRILRFLSQRVAPSVDPRSIGQALRGPDLGAWWKYRVGDYRIIAEIRDAEIRILVLRVAHRRELYRA